MDQYLQATWIDDEFYDSHFAPYLWIKEEVVNEIQGHLKTVTTRSMITCMTYDPLTPPTSEPGRAVSCQYLAK